MSLWTSILVLIVALIIFLLTFILLRKGRIPVKFSILWFLVSFILFLVGLFPSFISLISNLMGFQTMSNMLVGILIFILFLLTIALTVIVSGQTTKIIILIQEVSMLKKKINDMEKKNG